MAADVLLLQRLLDQQQAERVEPAQLGDVRQRVRGVGVDLEQQLVAEAFAHGTDRLHVPAGLDLQLDARVPLGHVSLDGVQELGDRVHDADRDPARHRVPGGAQRGGERRPLGAQFGVEHRHLQRRLGHPVPLDRGE